MHDNFARQEGQKSVILFTNLPPLDQLFAISVKVTTASSCTQTLNKFQPHIIKCREFIFTEPDVIGTPSADVNDNCFFLIAQAAVMKSGRLQARINKVGLQVTKPYPVTPDLYQSSLKYTLQARLSPNWNKVGQWYLQGRDFLSVSGCVHGIKMDVTMNQSELFFTLEATTFKTSPLQVTDLDITTSKLNTFLSNPAAKIDRPDIGSDWCFILPSLKKGRIVSITHDVPEECPFMSYRDLKRHWKNMVQPISRTVYLIYLPVYGYRLPEDDVGINYYQITFGHFGGKLFTYPEVCLRGRDLQRLSRIDPKPIMRSFMQEVQSKFPTVCGFPFKLQSKAKFTSVDFQVGSQLSVENTANLTNKMGNSRPPLYRSKEDMERLMKSNSRLNENIYCSSSQVSAQTISEMKQTTSSHMKYTPSLSQQKISSTLNKVQGMLSLNNQTPTATQIPRSISETPVHNRQTDTPMNNSTDQHNNPPIRKLFPTFNVRKSLFKINPPDQNTCQKVVPRFTASKRPYGIVSASSTASSTSQAITKQLSVGTSDSGIKINPNIISDQPLKKITPRFFQKKVQSLNIQQTPVSSIVKSRPATKDSNSSKAKQKSGKRTKTSKDGTGEAAKRRKMQKVEP